MLFGSAKIQLNDLTDTQRSLEAELVPAVCLELSESFLVIVGRISVCHKEYNRSERERRRIKEAVS